MAGLETVEVCIDLERSGHPVRPEAEAGDGCQHMLAGGPLHVRMPVDHPRDRLVGHAGRLGDVVDADRPGGARLAAGRVVREGVS